MTLAYISMPNVSIAAWPESVQPSKVAVQIISNTKRFESPFERYAQTQELLGASLLLEADFTGLDAAQARELRAFAARLRGSAGYFYFKVDASVVPIPPQAFTFDGWMSYKGWLARPRTLGDQDIGTVLKTIGWTGLSGALLISAGEYISFDDYLGFRHVHMLTQDVHMPVHTGSPAAVTVALPVAPSLTVLPPCDSDLMIDCPNGVFRLHDDSQLGITELPGGEFKATLSAVGAANPAGGGGGIYGMGPLVAGNQTPL